MTRKIRTYTELSRLRTFYERFEYLRLNGSIGRETFGVLRYLNQRFYTSTEWRRVRSQVIARDLACDLGVEGMEILDTIFIHHMNPLMLEDLGEDYSAALDPEFLICTSDNTHRAIHYKAALQEDTLPTERRPGDTKLW